MGSRRKSREFAVQALFFMDTRQRFTEENLMLFAENFVPSSPDVRPFFYHLVRGVVCSRNEIDAIIERFSDNWKVSRMSCVDRNIMRISVFEMLACKDVPAKVSINEAVDLGKKFGTDESGAFINGILDGIHMAMKAETFSVLVHESCERIPDETGGNATAAYPETAIDASPQPLIVIDAETSPDDGTPQQDTAVSAPSPDRKPRRRTLIR